MVVDEILDIVEQTVTVKQKSARKGLLGSAVVAKRVTDFVDLNEVINAARGTWLRSSGQETCGRIVLVVDPSSFSRGLIRSGLDMEGYIVLEASDHNEAVRQLERQRADLIVTSLDLHPGGVMRLISTLRKRVDWEKIPVLGVADSPDQICGYPIGSDGFQGIYVKFDTFAILDSIAKLTLHQGLPGMQPGDRETPKNKLLAEKF